MKNAELKKIPKTHEEKVKQDKIMIDILNEILKEESPE
jgi:hypothetical protein